MHVPKAKLMKGVHTRYPHDVLHDGQSMSSAPAPALQQHTPNACPLCLQAGYYCSVCDCILRDSASYLDHINGKYHNRALGMSMRVERSTADQVG